MLRNVISLLLFAAVSGAAQAAPDPKDMCTATSAAATIDAFRKFGGAVPDVKVATRLRYLPTGRPADLLVYRAYVKTAVDGGSATRITAYRIVVIDVEGPEAPLNLLSKDEVTAEAATQVALGTDFRKAESKEEKTLLSFTPSVGERHDYEGRPWRRTRLLVIGCGGQDASAAEVKAVLELPRSSIGWSRSIAILCCFLCYLFAATGTYYVHRRQSIDPGKLDPQQPKTGTNYAGWWQHLNPVVLTAGSNGMGSATKLQVFFFSLLVFGVALYIWLLSGYLTEMSSTVLLLMGISGLGATASAGAELTKNRMDFQNWSWLVNRGWLPKGGVAEVNMAKWKDIVTTGGEFDATRFQMITFTLLVGGALLMAGSDLMDLSSFEIPTTLLRILGLSQVVYVGGKLTSPPAVSDLNDQIQKLRKAESDLSVSLSKVNTGSFNHTTIPMIDDPDVQAATATYCGYLAEWDTSKTMFEATLGRVVPKWAYEMRPPFEVPDVVKPTPNALPDAKTSTPYTQNLAASGGVAKYTWTLAKGLLPPNLTISEEGQISGVPTAAGATKFTLKVTDANGVSNSREFVIKVL